MIARRIGADEKHQIGLVEIFQLKCTDATTKDAGEPNAAGRVAIIAAIVDVVGAVDTGEKLQQEARFVRAPAAGIEEGLTRRCLSKIGGNLCERLFPGDRAVVIVTARVNQRLDEAAERFKLARRESLKLRN